MKKRVEKIKPELPSGFRDYLPQEMIPRQKMLDVIRNTFELFGFDPLDTSVVEKLEVLTGGEESFRMNLFRTGIVKGIADGLTSSFKEMALRFDLTVPLARVVAANMDLPKPFKRYQMGYVFRGEKAQRGRFRGFMQFDADIVGSDSMLADTEIINLMYATMKALGVERFVIRFNNRKILNGLAKLADFFQPIEKRDEVFRIIDKLEKLGWDGVVGELKRQPQNNLDISAPKLNDKDIKIIADFLDLKGDSDELLAYLEELFKGVNIGLEGVNELKEIVANLKTLKIPQENWKVDLSVARGLGYYTGPVFETVLLDMPEIGSVFSGGRYDGLVNKFSEAIMPATGASIGVDRFFSAIEALKKVEKQNSLSQVLITVFDPSFNDDYLSLADDLRRAGVRVQIYMGQEMSFKAQLVYALNLEIPVLIIMGEDEKKESVVQIKDTRSRKQEKVRLEKVVDYVKELLK